MGSLLSRALLISDEEEHRKDQDEIAEGDHRSIEWSRSNIDVFRGDKAKQDREDRSDQA